MATPTQAFLHKHSVKFFSKQIALFVASGSGGKSLSISEAKEFCPGTAFTETLLLISSMLSQMAVWVAIWLEQIDANREKQNEKKAQLR